MQNEQLEIRVDGILQEPSAAERIGNTVLHGLVSLTEAAGRATLDLMGEIATNIELDMLDAKNGTSLRAEWFESRRQSKITTIRANLSL